MSEAPEDPEKPNWGAVKWYKGKDEEEEKPDTLRDKIVASVGIVILLGAGFGIAGVVLPYVIAGQSRSTGHYRSPDHALETVAEWDSKAWAMTRFGLGAAFGAFWAGVYIYQASRSDKGK